MNETLQQLVVAGIILGAIVYLGRRLLAAALGRKQGGCASHCGECSAAEHRKPLLEIQPLPTSRSENNSN